MKAKILIIGGGIMGTSVALEAARRADALRGPVVLLERGPIGAASSGRSGAILRLNYADKTVAVMARDSLRLYSSFEARSGRSIGFQKTGVLTLAGPDQPEWIERLQANVTMANEVGIPLEFVDAAKIRKLVDGISVRSGSFGAWEPLAGCVNAERALEAFASLARSYGAVTRIGVEVTEIKVEGGRVIGAVTSEGDYEADQVVIVAGPWSAKLLRQVGVELPLRTVRAENVFFASAEQDEEAGDVEEERESGLGFDMEDDPYEKVDAGTDLVAQRGPLPILIDLENGFYCRCESNRRVRVGHTDYADGEALVDPDALVEEVPEDTVAWAHEALSLRMPDYAERPHAGSIAGWHTLTPDAQAVIGRIGSVEGLFVATGFSGHGYKLAPAVGAGLAQMLFGEPVTAFEADFFAPDRFSGDETWRGKFGL